MSTIHIHGPQPGCQPSPASTHRGSCLRWGLALLLIVSVAASLRAAPVVDNNAGYFLDNYADSAGLFSSSQVQISPPGTVSLAPLNTAGSYRTVEIVPNSFDQWLDLTVAGTYGVLNDLKAEVFDLNGVSVLGPLPVNGPISLASLNSPLVPGLQVRVYFNKTAAVAPTVDSLRVTWRPVSRLLLDKQGPATVQAGETIVYDLRYSVSYVEAQDLVVWDTLPSSSAGTLVYPVAYGQNDNFTFISAKNGGVYTAAPTVVDGVPVPAHSVYWRLGKVPEGTTDLLSFTVATKSGTLNLTRATNCAYAKAANAA